MLKRARRLGLIVSNPVTSIPKLKKAGTRIADLSPAGEMAVLAALPTEYRPLVVFAAKTGLRWSEQARLRWLDVDLFSGFLTVRLGKNGQARRVPLNSAARGALVELSAQRVRPRDPNEQLSRAAYRTVSRAFVRAVKAAQASLRASNQGEETHPPRRGDMARSTAHLRFPSRGGWGRLACGSRTGRLAHIEHAPAVCSSVARSLARGRREDRDGPGSWKVAGTSTRLRVSGRGHQGTRWLD